MAQHPDELIHVMEDLASRGDRIATIWLLENVHRYGSKYGKRNSRENALARQKEQGLSGLNRWIYDLARDGVLPYTDDCNGGKRRKAGVVMAELLFQMAKRKLSGRYQKPPGAACDVTNFLGGLPEDEDPERRTVYAAKTGIRRSSLKPGRCTQLVPLPQLRAQLVAQGLPAQWEDPDADWEWREVSWDEWLPEMKRP